MRVHVEGRHKYPCTVRVRAIVHAPNKFEWLERLPEFCGFIILCSTSSFLRISSLLWSVLPFLYICWLFQKANITVHILFRIFLFLRTSGSTLSPASCDYSNFVTNFLLLKYTRCIHVHIFCNVLRLVRCFILLWKCLVKEIIAFLQVVIRSIPSPTDMHPTRTEGVFPVLRPAQERIRSRSHIADYVTSVSVVCVYAV